MYGRNTKICPNEFVNENNKISVWKKGKSWSNTDNMETGWDLGLPQTNVLYLNCLKQGALRYHKNQLSLGKKLNGMKF